MEIAAVIVAIAAILFVLIFVAGEERRKVQDDEEMIRQIAKDRAETGCIFCMFGCHLEKGENRFQRLKRTHPRQYEYCIGGGEYDESGKWIPNKDGLGLAKVLDYIGVDYE